VKLVTFALTDEDQRLGVHLDESVVVDVQRAHSIVSGTTERALASMQALIEGGEPALELVSRLRAAAPLNCRFEIGPSARLLAPLVRPEQIRDCLSFDQHLIGCAEAVRQRMGLAEILPRHRSMIQAMQARPLYYKANRFAVTGPDTEVTWPAYSKVRDYELEMAAVIGRKIKNATPEEARRAIFGYMIFNDFSARDTQTLEGEGGLGPAKAKDFDNANAMGPCLVTADEFDPYKATMTARLNGTIQSVGHSSSMNRSFEDQISYISQSETLYPGEVIGSGTVGGGSGLEKGRLLEDGDVIELEIEGIGVLRNRIRVPG
jgi:2-keto-4-pentenoate hydratase/2-oxohepta-3-ene-1,7-dioic acid hydratase in catechol pathway